MRNISFALFTVLLFGCSQSSDSETSQIAPPVLAEPDIAIVSDNAVKIAQAGTRGGFDLLRLSYIGARFMQTTFPPPPEPTEPDPTNPEPTEPEPVEPGPVQSIAVFGPDEGVATFSWEDVNEDGKYSSEDVFLVNFNQYGDQGMVLNGIMSIDDVQLQGLLPGDGTYILKATLNLLGLSVRIGSLTQTFNTKLPFFMENRIIVEIYELLLEEPLVLGALEVQAGTLLSRLTTDQAVRYLMDGAVNSAELGGTVRFSTPTGLRGSPFLSDPTEGTLLINGANGSALEIEPVCLFPGVCISLDLHLDEDGDEEFETTLTSSWQSLLPQQQL